MRMNVAKLAVLLIAPRRRFAAALGLSIACFGCNADDSGAVGMAASQAGNGSQAPAGAQSSGTTRPQPLDSGLGLIAPAQDAGPPVVFMPGTAIEPGDVGTVDVTLQVR